jgi:protein-S-isoprenylcysteine O-methyltransferase Ste14
MELPVLDLSPWAIPATALLYGLVHSMMASIGFKDLLYTLVGRPAERYYRLFYNFISGVTFLPVLALTLMIPDKTLYSIPHPWTILTLGIQVVSAALLVFSLLQTGAFQFIGISQALGLKTTETLNTAGLYRYIRHPLYAFSLLFIWLTPTMSLNIFLLYAALTVYIIIGAIYEERKLERVFGEAYRKYKARTAFLVPFII